MPPSAAAVTALRSMEDAMRQSGRGFGPGGTGAPAPIAAPPAALVKPPREIRDGEILLGHATNKDAIGLGLAKLIDGRLLVQGNSGAGKSTLLRRLFEQAFGKVQLLLLDRDGEFSSLAEIVDVAVFASADVLRIGGQAFARHLREHRYSAIVDLSDATVKLTEIARQLAEGGFRRRSIGSISTRARALGCESNSPIARGAWSPEEDQILIAGYADPDIKIMDVVGMLTAAGFDRGRVSVQMRAIALGVTRDRVNYYTEEEIAIAKAGLEAGKSNRDIITDLREAGYHRGVTSISKFAQKHGYDRSAEPWTPEQIDELVRLYGEKKPVKEIAELLGKPISTIRTRASNMNLKQRVAWSDREYERLQELWRDGKTLSQAVQLMGRPYPNVARIALSLGLNFSILSAERGKAVALQKVGRAPATVEGRTKEMRKTPVELGSQGKHRK